MGNGACCPGWWGWLGRPRGSAARKEENPSPEERRRVKLGVTRPAGLCQVKQNALPAPGTGPKATEARQFAAVSRYPRNPLQNILSLRNTRPQKTRASRRVAVTVPATGSDQRWRGQPSS